MFYCRLHPHIIINIITIITIINIIIVVVILLHIDGYMNLPSFNIVLLIEHIVFVRETLNFRIKIITITG